MKTLKLNQMESINGAVSVKEYCGTLKIIMDNNEVTESMEFFYGYFNCGYYNNQ
jgi:hypothetical protein